MGFYSQVQITAEAGAFKMFDEVLKKHGLRYGRSGDDIKVISIDWIKWHSASGCVEDIRRLQGKLCTDDFDEKEGYAFKSIVLNEDSSNEEWCNTRGSGLFFDVCIECHISNPYVVQPLENPERV